MKELAGRGVRGEAGEETLFCLLVSRGIFGGKWETRKGRERWKATRPCTVFQLNKTVAVQHAMDAVSTWTAVIEHGENPVTFWQRERVSWTRQKWGNDIHDLRIAFGSVDRPCLAVGSLRCRTGNLGLGLYTARRV